MFFLSLPESPETRSSVDFSSVDICFTTLPAQYIHKQKIASQLVIRQLWRSAN